MSRSRNWILVAVVALLAGCETLDASLTGSRAPISVDNLFTPVSPPVFEPGEDGPLAGRPVRQVRYVSFNTVNTNSVFDNDPPFIVQLTLFDDAEYLVIVESLSVTRDIHTLSGRIAAGHRGQVELVFGGMLVRGVVQADERIFEFVPVDASVIAIVELAHEDFPREGEPLPIDKADPPPARPETSRRRPAGDPVFLASADPGPIVLAAAESSDLLAPESTWPEIRILVVQSDQQYTDVECSETQRLAKAALLQKQLAGAFRPFARVSVILECIDYEPVGGDLSADRDHLRDDCDIHELRMDAEADLVVMLVKHADSCGWSVFPNYPDYPISERTIPEEEPMAGYGTWAEYFAAAAAFSVVKEKCTTGNYSVVHEVGHLFGMKHERFSEWGGVAGDCGYGYPVMHRRKPVGRTALAYPGYCSYHGVASRDCPRYPVYSLPLQREPGLIGWFRWTFRHCLSEIKGQPCDAPGSDTLQSAAHNHRRLGDTASIVARYSDLVPQCP